ncbi:hypothetical protein APHAL10511_008335 [Amanita phalloides]|nr:hypothetical protein APHAL10511_008335 [Amanita phalloides]
MDFFLVNPTSVEKSSREKGTIVHHILLQVMDFAVIAFLHEKGLEEMARLSREASSEKSDPSPVFAAIRILSESIRDVSQSLLGSLSLTNWRSQPNMLQVLTKAMSYGTYLQRIIRNSALDYSALLALARCILDALNIESPQLITLQHHARSLNDFVSLTSGLGLLDIWSSLYCDGSLYLAKSRLFRLNELASSLNDGADRDGLRRRVLDCMTLTAVKVDDDEKKTALTELELELKHLHREYGKGHVDDRCIDSTFMIIELNLLSSYGFKLNIVKEIIDATVARSDSSLLRVATYRQMSWSIETGKHVLPLTVHTHLQWLHDVWELRYDNEGGDPAILLRPVLLRNTINLK